MIKIREKITELRHKQNLSQIQMADRLDITQAAYNKIETGKTHLAVKHLLKISEVLKVCPSELIKLGVRNPQSDD